MGKESPAKTLTEFKRSLAKFDSDKINVFDSLCLLYSMLYCYKLIGSLCTGILLCCKEHLCS